MRMWMCFGAFLCEWLEVILGFSSPRRLFPISGARKREKTRWKERQHLFPVSMTIRDWIWCLEGSLQVTKRSMKRSMKPGGDGCYFNTNMIKDFKPSSAFSTAYQHHTHSAKISHSAVLIFSSHSQIQYRMLQKINFNDYADSEGRQSGVETYGVIETNSSDERGAQSKPNTTHPRPWHRWERGDDRINRQKVVEKGRDWRIIIWEDKHGVKSHAYTHSLSKAVGKHKKHYLSQY